MRHREISSKDRRAMSGLDSLRVYYDIGSDSWWLLSADGSRGTELPADTRVNWLLGGPWHGVGGPERG